MVEQQMPVEVVKWDVGVAKIRANDKAATSLYDLWSSDDD